MAVAATRAMRRVGLAVLIAVPLAWLGCHGSASDEGKTGSADTAPATCEIFLPRENRLMTPDEIAHLDDPVVRLLLRTPGPCPATFEEIQERLRKTDADGCPDDPQGLPAGTVTWMQSDDSQLLHRGGLYRSVTARRCGDRRDSELLISNQPFHALSPGTDAGAEPLPDGMVVFGQDRTTGGFDFYRPGLSWSFVGSSAELVSGGYDCNADGACHPKSAAQAFCTGCHAGGGLAMMELRFPWVNWEGAIDTPGTLDIFQAYGKSLGARSRAPNLSSLVVAGNEPWTKTRVGVLKNEGTEELLRPLFCTVDVNLRTSESAQLTRINPDLWLDPHWNVSTPVFVSHADYTAAIARNRQVLGAGTDTVFPLIHPERSALDARYVDELLAQAIVDEDFVRDVLFTDFTRPTFSPTRCALVQHAPKLGPSEMNPTAIREGFKATLANAPEAEAKSLLARLGDPNDGEAHLAEVNGFIDACAARPPADLVSDAVAFASAQRRAVQANFVANPFGNIRLPAVLPSDSLPQSPVVFDPKTCALR